DPGKHGRARVAAPHDESASLDGGATYRGCMASMVRVAVKRVYDDPGPEDGVRVLVDRLWPRGLSKGDARIDEWRKDVAPSTELRQWYAHDPDRHEVFAARYRAELDDATDALRELRDQAGSGPL